MLGGA
jgi:hypothetical protein